MMRQLLTCSVAMAGLLVWGAGAQAATISWNVDHNGTVGGDGAGSLPPLTEEAGVVQVSGWTNTWPDNQTTDLRDNSGNATTMDIAWQSFNTWSIGGHPGQDTDGSWNMEMINGYLNSGPAGWDPPIVNSEVALTEIPYPNYDVIVYFSSDVAGREGDVTDLTTTYSFNTVGPPSVAGPDALLVQTTDTAGTYSAAANYAVFSGLSGSSQTLQVQMRDDDEWGGIAAVQVVEIPEPASLALMGLGGVLLVSRWRR